MDELIRLKEKDEVADRITALFVETDSRNWAQVQACFADKVHFDQTSLVGGTPATVTPAEITVGWDKGLKPIKAVHHQIGNLRINVGDGRATASCYGIALHYLPNSTGRNTRTFVGSYEFGLTKITEGWKIDSFVFNLAFIDGNSKLEENA